VRALKELKYPSIVELLDSGTDKESNCLFLVLEWMDSDLSDMPYQKSIGTLLDHQHRGGVLKDMRVLQGLAEPGLLGDSSEQLVDRDPVHLS